MAILKIKDQDGNIIEIPAIRGEKGDKGDTPVKGTDYWTAEDIAEIKGYVDDAILGGEW